MPKPKDPEKSQNIESMFAATTKVPVERSIQHIKDAITKRYKGEILQEGWDHEGGAFALTFKVGELRVRLQIPVEKDNPQLAKQRFRVLYLLVLGQFEAVACGLKSEYEAFLDDLIMTDGNTVSVVIEDLIRDGALPKRLALPEPKKQP